MENRIRKIVQDVLDTSDVPDMDTPLETYGLTSLGLIEIILAVEETFNCELRSELLSYGKMNTIRKIVAGVEISKEPI